MLNVKRAVSIFGFVFLFGQVGVADTVVKGQKVLRRDVSNQLWFGQVLDINGTNQTALVNWRQFVHKEINLKEWISFSELIGAVDQYQGIISGQTIHTILAKKDHFEGKVKRVFSDGTLFLKETGQKNHFIADAQEIKEHGVLIEGVGSVSRHQKLKLIENFRLKDNAYLNQTVAMVCIAKVIDVYTDGWIKAHLKPIEKKYQGRVAFLRLSDLKFVK